MRKSAVAVVVLAGLTVAGCASTNSAGSGPAAGPTSPAGPAGGLNGTSTGPGMGGTASVAPSSSTGSSASVQAIAATCPSQQSFAMLNGPTAKPIPVDIQVAWVLRCTIVTKTGDRTLVAERSGGDPKALVAALKVPSAQRANGLCPMYVINTPYFALVETDGKVFVPKVPVTNCNKPQVAVIQALNSLRFSVLSSKALS
ncbi:MAG: hypothetical protein M3Y89_14425 [Actinomycetota bacterium]|nr:hypothetical protein [Actinomycetota bacterium]